MEKILISRFRKRVMRGFFAVSEKKKSGRGGRSDVNKGGFG